MSRWRDQDDNHNPIEIGRVIRSGGNPRAIVAILFLTIPEPTAFGPRTREPPLLINILIVRLQYPEPGGTATYNRQRDGRFPYSIRARRFFGAG